MTFASLFHPAVAAWFERSFAAPTGAQAEAWPAIAQGRHVLIAAPTGAGKTLAAFLAAIDGLVRQGIEAPLAEETLFRGIIFQGLRNLCSRWAPNGVAIFLAALVSGVVFGLAHLEIHTLPILALLGIVLAYVFQYGRSIFASALVHGLVNILAVISLLQSG